MGTLADQDPRGNNRSPPLEKCAQAPVRFGALERSAGKGGQRVGRLRCNVIEPGDRLDLLLGRLLVDAQMPIAKKLSRLAKRQVFLRCHYRLDQAPNEKPRHNRRP